jgi:hypothetical protein
MLPLTPVDASSGRHTVIVRSTSTQSDVAARGMTSGDGPLVISGGAGTRGPNVVAALKAFVSSFECSRGARSSSLWARPGSSMVTDGDFKINTCAAPAPRRRSPPTELIMDAPISSSAMAARRWSGVQDLPSTSLAVVNNVAGRAISTNRSMSSAARPLARSIFTPGLISVHASPPPPPPRTAGSGARGDAPDGSWADPTVNSGMAPAWPNRARTHAHHGL